MSVPNWLWSGICCGVFLLSQYGKWFDERYAGVNFIIGLVFTFCLLAVGVFINVWLEMRDRK
jgi:hypothetical protein